MSNQIYKLYKDGTEYEYEIHRAPQGCFAMWRCIECRSAGGSTAVYDSRDHALQAVRRLIAGHHRQEHSLLVDQDLTALLYCSRAVEVFDESMLRKLERESEQKNKRLEITGYLHYDASSELFFQFLEGPRFALDELMESITFDPRHRILSSFRFTPAEREAALTIAREDGSLISKRDLSLKLFESSDRLFPHWRMKWIPRADFRALSLEETLNTVLLAVRDPYPPGQAFYRAVVELCFQLSSRVRS